MRQRTQQPEQYLKETLSEIAVLHRSGEHSGKWGLQEAFKGSNGPGMVSAMGGVKLEAGGVGRVKSEPGTTYSSGMEEDEDDDEEDYEMEEVS